MDFVTVAIPLAIYPPIKKGAAGPPAAAAAVAPAIVEEIDLAVSIVY